jgi:tetraacyldisaccharide 4'-kinase
MPFKIIDNRRESSLRRAVEPGSGAGGAVTRGIMSVVSEMYRVGLNSNTRKLRRRPVQKLSVPVISVGNITAGGTGKTPVCLYLAGQLNSAGFTVGIATRGYGRRDTQPVTATRENNQGWRQTGDEPQLYLNHGHVRAVAVDPDRYRASADLAANHACGVVLLDDGFHFITLARVADIVCLDVRNPFGYNRLLPRGTLREPVSALTRATHFWLTHATDKNASQTRELLDTLNKDYPDIPVILSRHEPVSVHPIGDSGNQPHSTDTLAGQTLCALSAIGSPESFEHTLETLSGNKVLAIRYSDHHAFTEKQLREADRLARENGCGAVITTEKDAVRIPPGFTPQMPWRMLTIGMRVTAGAEHVEQIIESIK